MTALHDLAYTRQAQGDLDEAEQLFQQVREYRSDKLCRDHPNTLITEHNLAWLLHAPG
ncbi:tetratricopeptide repeat protein [Actinomycetes bacterium KLBMP 9797]